MLIEDYTVILTDVLADWCHLPENTFTDFIIYKLACNEDFCK